MKTSRIVPVATLALAFGFAALACAAQDRPSQDKNHPKQDNKQQQARPEQQHAGQRSQQPAEPSRPSAESRPPAQQQQRQNQSVRRTGESRPAAREQSQPTARRPDYTAERRGATRGRPNENRGAQQTAWQQHRANNWQSDHRNWQQRGGYHGYRVPDSRFRGYFGPGHGFLIRGLPFMVVGGFPRFQYNGYWLTVVDPWPQQWGNDWYDSDQVYIDYADGGYYLYNRSYPGVGIAVSISM